MAAVLVWSGSAQAATLGEFDQSVVSEYNRIKSVYLKQKTQYETSRKDYLNAKGKWQTNKGKQWGDEVLADAREYMTQAADTAIKYLDVVEYKVKNSPLADADKNKILGEINADQEWLESKKGEINSASAKQDLTSILKAIRTRWEEIKAETKRYTGEILAAKMDYVLGKIESAQTQINTRISKAKSDGYDVSEIENENAELTKNIDLAQDKIDAAKKDFNAIAGLNNSDSFFKSGNKDLTEANGYLVKAHNNIKEMVRMAEKQIVKKKNVSGEGEIRVEGKGTANIEGDGTVAASTDKSGSVEIKGNAAVTTEGTGQKTDLGSGIIRYAGYGKVTAVGTDMEITVNGNELAVEASGTGTVNLKGDGTYSTGGGAEKTITGQVNF